jgi:hypothetical protein
MSDTAPETTTEETSAPAAPAPVRLTMTAAVAIEKYVKLRDKLAEIKKEQSAFNLKYTAAMELIEGHLLTMLDNDNLENIKAEAGTAYKSTLTSATVKEWHKTLEFIKEHAMWELLEPRVSKTVVEETLKNTGEMIPGVVITQRVNLNVRRS